MPNRCAAIGSPHGCRATGLLARRGAASAAVDGAARRGALALLVLCAGATAVFARSDAEVTRTVALAIPPAVAAKAHWHEERDAFAAKLVRGYGLNHDVAREFTGWILEASVRQGLAAELLASLVVTESSFRKHVRSPAGATGPAQVRADLWGEFCGGFLDHPDQNVYCGAQILAYYHDVCRLDAAEAADAEACALRSYNVGYGNRRNSYFVAAAARYLAKIDRYRSLLEDAA